MKQKTRIIIYIAIAVTVLVSGILAVLSSSQGAAEKAQKFIDLGNKYLIELSYDKAVIEFNKAIEIEPKNADAYIGLAEAYIGLGDTDSAVDALKRGYDLTGDERIKAMLDELLPSTDDERKMDELEEGISGDSDVNTTISENVSEENVELYIPVNIKYTGNLDFLHYNDPNTVFSSIIVNDIKYELSFNELYIDNVTLRDERLFYDSSYVDPYFSRKDFRFVFSKDYLLDLRCNANNRYYLSLNYDIRKYDFDYEHLEILNNRFVSPYSYLREYDEFGYLSSVSYGDWVVNYVYDDHHNLLYIESGSDNEKVWIREYNQNDLCIKETHYDSRGDINTIYEYEYDNKDRLVRMVDSIPAGNWQTIYEFDYDINDNLIESREYHFNEGYEYVKVDKYDLYGNSIFYGYYENDRLDRGGKNEFEYDENGNIVLERYFMLDVNPDGSYTDRLYHEIVYKYDSHNNVLEKNKITYLSDPKEEKTQYEYIYNDDGVPEKVVIYSDGEKHEYELEYAILEIPASVYAEIIA